MNFVKRQNLPEFQVKHLIIGQKYLNFLSKPLAEMNINPIYVPDNPDVDSRLEGHADLSVVHMSENRLVTAKFLRDSDFYGKLTELGANIVIAEHKQSPEYPNDANLNVCFLNKIIIYSETAVDNEIAKSLTKVGAIPVKCRQGYCRCSVCVVDENSIITADAGIAKAALAAGIDVLTVEPGLAELPGFSQGFIGGATFKLASDKLAFTGQIENKIQKIKIENFLKHKNVKPIYLTQNPLLDIGGAIPLTEQ